MTDTRNAVLLSLRIGRAGMAAAQAPLERLAELDKQTDAFATADLAGDRRGASRALHAIAAICPAAEGIAIGYDLQHAALGLTAGLNALLRRRGPE